MILTSLVPVCSFMPSFLRLGSWNIVMFVSYEQIKRAVMRFQQTWEPPLRPVWQLVWHSAYQQRWINCCCLDLFALRRCISKNKTKKNITLQSETAGRINKHVLMTSLSRCTLGTCWLFSTGDTLTGMDKCVCFICLLTRGIWLSLTVNKNAVTSNTGNVKVCKREGSTDIDMKTWLVYMY